MPQLDFFFFMNALLFFLFYISLSFFLFALFFVPFLSSHEIVARTLLALSTQFSYIVFQKFYIKSYTTFYSYTLNDQLLIGKCLNVNSFITKEYSTVLTLSNLKTKSHLFHIVGASNLPLSLSFFLGLFAMSLVSFLHGL